MSMMKLFLYRYLTDRGVPMLNLRRVLDRLRFQIGMQTLKSRGSIQYLLAKY